MVKPNPIKVGAGFRRPHFQQIVSNPNSSIQFFELAPENWMKVGGVRKQELQFLADHYPLICHGLSLSLGGMTPLDFDFLTDLKNFLNQYQISIYSEHLSYSSDSAQLYDLLPIPFTEDAVHYVANRIKQVQDFLERPIAIENISYYLLAGAEMSEVEFINNVIAESNCELLLDINNIYVNSINHQYSAEDFIEKLKPKKISYFHVAGHNKIADDLIIDSHGATIIDPVWKLLEIAYTKFGVCPTVLERDNNIPDFSELLAELDTIKKIQSEYL